MTRIFVQRGSGGSSSGANRSSQQQQQLAGTPGRDEELQERGVLQEYEQCTGNEERGQRKDEVGMPENEGKINPCVEGTEELGAPSMELEGLQLQAVGGDLCFDNTGAVVGGSRPPPPPVPPPKLLGPPTSTRTVSSGGSGTVRNAALRSQIGRPPLPLWGGSQSDSRPTSPKSFGDAEGYNSADEQSSYFGPSYNDPEKERTFEIDIKRIRGLELKKMAADGNCLFRAVADQVYGDPEAHNTSRQMCIDYMERERDHFSQFVVESFSTYCKRKRRDKVYGNNIEIQAFSEMYNRPIHIYCYSTEPINIFHGGYDTDTPPIRLSYHHGNHYNSLVDPRRLSIGAGLGLSSLRGANIDKDQVKAAIKAQQDQQIENALLAEGRFYSDVELTEKEIERMVMEASRAEYLAKDRFKQPLGSKVSSTSAAAEPSSSGARPPSIGTAKRAMQEESSTVLSDSIHMVLAMGFGYLQAIEAYSIFGDDVDSMVCYLLETETSSSPGCSRRKGKATE